VETNWWEVGAAMGGSACTLVLAIAAFLTIRDSRNAQRIDRRNKLLKEIVDWAVDILRCEFFEVPEFSAQASALKDTQYIEYMKSRQSITALNAKARYQAVMARNAYVGTIAERLDAEYHAQMLPDLKVTNEAIKAHFQLLDKARDGQIDQTEYMRSWHAVVAKAELLINKATTQLAK
jgi:hypothetical protein